MNIQKIDNHIGNRIYNVNIIYCYDELKFQNSEGMASYYLFLSSPNCQGGYQCIILCDQFFEQGQVCLNPQSQ